MVLVDTSIWIRFLANRSPEAEELQRLLIRGEVLGHELVYGELLMGDRGGREQVLRRYDLIRRATTVPHGEVVEFVHDRKLHGRGVEWIDIHLLASALVEHLQVWTADPRFAAMAAELGVAYSSDHTVH